MIEKQASGEFRSPVQSGGPRPSADPPGTTAGLRWGMPGPRAAVRLVGPDAARFLDGFVTAAVTRLSVGEGAEGFLTDAKGWVLALAQILRTPDGILLDVDAGRAAPAGGPSVPPLGERLRAHLEHYHIREKVEIEDVSRDRAAIVLAGRDASAWVARRLAIAPPPRPLSHAAGSIGTAAVTVVRIDWMGEEAFLLLFDAPDLERLADTFATDGIPRLTGEAIDAARIERGFPSADDIPERTLPQELGRDDVAISFTKGCYLGQETVARIDAIGHVNRRLTGIAGQGTTPRFGAVVTADGEPVGTLTSGCRSRLGGWLGMGIVHVKATASAAVAVDGVPARLVALPLREQEPARRVVFEAKRFRIVSVDEPLADGTTRTREVVEHPGSVVILPMIEEAGGPGAPSAEPKVCLVENWRIAVGRPLLELPAGTLDRDEPIADAARRELAEETGYRAGRLVAAGSFWMSPGILRERMHLFRAESLVAGPQALEPGERIVVRVVGWSEAVAMCLDGRIDDAKSIAGIMLEHVRRQQVGGR